MRRKHFDQLIQNRNKKRTGGNKKICKLYNDKSLNARKMMTKLTVFGYYLKETNSLCFSHFLFRFGF